METLGSFLKEIREVNSFTLRQIEDFTGISNAYLSLLENDKIKKPSANVLYKLASVYKIELSVLLSAAGIIQKKDDDVAEEQNILAQRIAFYASKLSKDEQKEVFNYLKFIKHKNKNG
jgi:transcriptional regulator with XRE-family HTH domain